MCPRHTEVRDAERHQDWLEKATGQKPWESHHNPPWSIKDGILMGLFVVGIVGTFLYEMIRAWNIH